MVSILGMSLGCVCGDISSDLEGAKGDVKLLDLFVALVEEMRIKPTDG